MWPTGRESLLGHSAVSERENERGRGNKTCPRPPHPTHTTALQQHHGLLFDSQRSYREFRKPPPLLRPKEEKRRAKTLISYISCRFSRALDESSGIAFRNACVKVDSHPRMPVPAGRMVGRGTSQTSSTMKPACIRTNKRPTSARRGTGMSEEAPGRRESVVYPAIERIYPG